MVKCNNWFSKSSQGLPLEIPKIRGLILYNTHSVQISKTGPYMEVFLTESWDQKKDKQNNFLKQPAASSWEIVPLGYFSPKTVTLSEETVPLDLFSEKLCRQVRGTCSTWKNVHTQAV